MKRTHETHLSGLDTHTLYKNYTSYETIMRTLISGMKYKLNILSVYYLLIVQSVNRVTCQEKTWLNRMSEEA